MAYRRRQGISRVSTFKEEIHYPPDDPTFASPPPTSSNSNPIPDPDPDLNPNPNPNSSSLYSSSSSSSSLAAQAIRASAQHRESSLSSAYGDSAFSYAYRGSDHQRSQPPTQYEYTSLKSPNDSKYGFWSILAKKAKSILDDDEQQEMSSSAKPQMSDTSESGLFPQPYQSSDSFRRVDNPKLRKSIDAITSSLNQIGGTIGNAFEEGRTIVENKTADIIQETRKLQIRKKGSSSPMQNQAFGVDGSLGQPFAQTNQETQLKASRDVAMATAAKAKLLLRELKTVKADLAFAKERCAQLEEENKILRENRAKGANPADDDLIRLQLETLLAEKARLAHENSIYTRENRFLREIVEYHQLTMQDVVYLDEGIEEVTEVSPITRILSVSPPSTSPTGSPTEFRRRSISAQPTSKDVALRLSFDDTAENGLGEKSTPEPSSSTHEAKHMERSADASCLN